VAAVFWLRSNDRFLHYANDYRTTIFHTNFEEHLIATYKLKDMSTAERFYRWVAGVRMIKDGWRTGFGPNTFYENYKSYALPAFKTWVSKNEERSTLHNYFLLQLVEQGVIGLLLFLSLIAAMLWYVQTIYRRTSDRFWKVTMAATASIIIMLCVINFLSDMIETDKVGSVFYLCVAVIIVADRKTRSLSHFSSNIQRIS
jgi:O-antigen ligase